MKLTNPGAEFFVPDGAAPEEALRRTTHLSVAAHQDDLEIMAYHGILECFGKEPRGFLGITVTNGAGSPRDHLYARYSDAEMQRVRKLEQKKAAWVGEYSASLLLDYPSAAVKNASDRRLEEELERIFRRVKPAMLYTHNLCDKHDTHVAVALRTLAALRRLPPDHRPGRVLGCEVWRDLDWLPDKDKVALDVDGHENLAAALVGVFDSQICGGKRYDLATLGRRRAHATFHASHGTDKTLGLTFAMDMTPLLTDPQRDPKAFALDAIAAFSREVAERVGRVSSE